MALVNGDYLHYTDMKKFLENLLCNYLLDFEIISQKCSWPYCFPFYTPVEDGTYYGITRGGQAGGRRPVLCPEHISKTTLPRVMKFHGWIDLIQGECSAQES